MGGGASHKREEKGVLYSQADRAYDPRRDKGGGRRTSTVDPSQTPFASVEAVDDRELSKRQLWVPMPRNMRITSGKIYIAQFDFTGVDKIRDDGTRLDLPFKENSQVLVKQRVQKTGWWLAQMERRSGYVPSSYLDPKPRYIAGKCYFPDSSPKEIESCLADCADGQYLIRDIKTDGTGEVFDNMDLAVKTEHKVEHYLIHAIFQLERRKFKEFYYIDERHCFDSLSKLLKHYSENGGLAVKLNHTSTFHKPQETTDRYNKDKKYSNTSWELSREKLVLEEKPLGEGHFGEVYKGRWIERDKKTGVEDILTVAVKTLKDATNEPEAFKQEADVMTKIKHRNLVRIFGVCTETAPILIVTEYCGGGSLLTYLKGSEEGQKCSMKKLIKMIGQIAAGMMHLEKVKIVHRDLAARNVLLTDTLKCKVCDFGLARYLIPDDEYIGNKKSKFPMRWTAIEGLTQTRFTLKSDVWSFGVLCFEITSRGEAPYKGIETKKIQEILEKGYRLEKPEECPQWLYLIMSRCWKEDPHQRYSFRHIRKLIKKHYKKHCKNGSELDASKSTANASSFFSH